MRTEDVSTLRENEANLFSNIATNESSTGSVSILHYDT